MHSLCTENISPLPYPDLEKWCSACWCAWKLLFPHRSTHGKDFMRQLDFPHRSTHGRDFVRQLDSIPATWQCAIAQQQFPCASFLQCTSIICQFHGSFNSHHAHTVQPYFIAPVALAPSTIIALQDNIAESDVSAMGSSMCVPYHAWRLNCIHLVCVACS